MDDDSESSEKNPKTPPLVEDLSENTSKSSDEPKDDESSETTEGTTKPASNVFEVPDDVKEPKKVETTQEDTGSIFESMKSSEDVSKFPPETQESAEKKIESPTEKPDEGPLDTKAEKDDGSSLESVKSSENDDKSSGEGQESTEKISESPRKTPDKDAKPMPSILKKSSAEVHEERVQVSEDSPESSEDSPESSEDTDESSKPPKSSSFSDRLKQKRDSVVSFFTGKSKDDEEEEDDLTPRPRKRSSFVKRKLMALEQELTADNINKKVMNIFDPEPDSKDEGKDDTDQDEEKPTRIYLSSAMACMFLISATTGSALTGLPYYLKESSWFGVFLNLLLGFNSLYGGLCIARCWSIMEEKWPEYLEYTRVPYQDIAYRAAGKWMKYIVGICVDLTILGSCAGYLTSIADSFENITYSTFKYCYMLLAVSVLAMPIMMFGSYRNIRIIGVLDVLFSLGFSLLLIISFFLDKRREGVSTYSDPADGVAATRAFSGFSYAYGLGAILPSIMADMSDRSRFVHTVATAYMIIIPIYILVSIMGYAAYGDQTPIYILKKLLQNEEFYVLAVVIDVIHILQLTTTYIVALIPTLHAFEVRVNCPDRFCIWRFIVRMTVMLCILLVVLGVPNISKITDIIAGSTMNLATYIFPPIFYVCLVYRTRWESKSSKRTISKKEWFFVTEIIVLGVTVGVIATYMSIMTLIETPFDRVSCYENITSFPGSKDWLKKKFTD